MSVLSDAKLREVYDSKGCHDAGLRAVAEAAIAADRADRAARAEPVYAFRRRGFNDFCTCDERRYLELSQKPSFEVAIFYTAPPAAPVVTTEEGRHCGDPDCVPCRDPAEPAATGEQVGLTNAEIDKAADEYAAPCIDDCYLDRGDWRPHMRLFARAVIAAHEAKRASCSQTAKTSTREGGRVNETEKSEQVAEAVKAERERIYALLDSNPEHIWRDAGFMQWRAKRSQENHE